MQKPLLRTQQMNAFAVSSLKIPAQNQHQQQGSLKIPNHGLKPAEYLNEIYKSTSKEDFQTNLNHLLKSLKIDKSSSPSVQNRIGLIDDELRFTFEVIDVKLAELLVGYTTDLQGDQLIEALRISYENSLSNTMNLFEYFISRTSFTKQFTHFQLAEILDAFVQNQALLRYRSEIDYFTMVEKIYTQVVVDLKDDLTEEADRIEAIQKRQLKKKEEGGVKNQGSEELVRRVTVEDLVKLKQLKDVEFVEMSLEFFDVALIQNFGILEQDFKDDEGLEELKETIFGKAP